MPLEAKQVGNTVTGKHNNVTWQDLVMDKKLNLYERRIMQKLLDQYESEESQISQETKKALNAFVKSDFMGKNEAKVRAWFDGKNFSLEQIGTIIGAESTEGIEFIAKLVQWQKKNIWVMKSIAKAHPDSLREGADLEKESLADGIIDQLTLRALFPEEAVPVTSPETPPIAADMSDQGKPSNQDSVVPVAVPEAQTSVMKNPPVLSSNSVDEGVTGVDPDNSALLGVQETTATALSNPEISDENQQKKEINILLSTLETATLWLHEDNKLDPQEKIDAANQALKAIKESPAYSQLAFSGGIEQKTPETQKVTELEWLVKRAENKMLICISTKNKISGVDIEWDNADWVNMNDEKTTIYFNENWTVRDRAIYSAGDSMAWFTTKEAFDIILENKGYFQEGKSWAATQREKPKENIWSEQEILKSIERRNKLRTAANHLQKTNDSSGKNYQDTPELKTSEYSKENLWYVDYLEWMMKNFHTQWWWNNEQQTKLAQLWVKYTGENLEETKKDNEQLKQIIDTETNPNKKLQLQSTYDKQFQEYRDDQKKYITLASNLGNSHEEQEEFINGDLAVREATNYIVGCKTADEAITYLREIHAKILGNNYQQSKAKEVYQQITKAVGRSVFEKIQNDTTLDQKQKNAKMVELARLVSQKDVDIDDDVQDSELAIDVLEQVISMPDAAIGCMQKQNREMPLTSEVAKKKAEVLPALAAFEQQAKDANLTVPSIITPEQQQILASNPKTLQEISVQYTLIRYLELAVKNIEIAKRRSATNPPSSEPYLTLNQSEIQDTLNKSMVPYIEAGTKQLYETLDTKWATLQDFQNVTGIVMTAEQQNAYTTLKDVKWLGWWDISDATSSSIKNASKIAGMIAVGIAAGVLTGGTGFVAYAAAGLAMTAAECAIFNKAMGVKEAVTTTAINTAGMAVGWVLTWASKIGQWARAGLSGIASSGIRGVSSAARVWRSALGAIDDAVTAGGKTAVVWLVADSGINYVAGAAMEGARQQIMEWKWSAEAFIAALTDPTSLAMIGVPIGMHIWKNFRSGPTPHIILSERPGTSPALWTQEMQEGYAIIQEIHTQFPDKNLEQIRDMLRNGSGDPVIDAKIDALWHTYDQNKRSQYDNGHVVDIAEQVPGVIQDLPPETVIPHSETPSSTIPHQENIPQETVTQDPMISTREMPDHPNATPRSRMDNATVERLARISDSRTNDVRVIALNRQAINPAYQKFSQSASRHNVQYPHEIHVGEMTLIASDRYIYRYSNGTTREIIIATTPEGHPRLFYKSNSGWGWHSTQWIRRNGGFGKWEIEDVGRDTSYEKTGNVAIGVQKVFDELPPLPQNTREGTILDDLAPRSDNALRNNLVWDFNNEININDVRTEWPSKCDAFASLSDKPYNVDQLKTLFGQSDIIWFWGSLKRTWETTFTHTILGECILDKMEGYIGSEKVIFEFAYAQNDPGNPWVHNIRSADSKISSFGVESKQFLGGLTYAKPLEYKTAIHKNAQKWLTVMLGGTYSDIRPLIQQLPIIKAYKKSKLVTASL